MRSSTRSAVPRFIAASVAALLLTSGLPAQAAPQKKASGTKAAVNADSLREIALLKEEDAFFHRKTMEFRSRYLRNSAWAELGDRCNPGALRIFPKDTTPLQRDSLTKLAMRIEQTVIGRGAGNTPIDTPDGRALLRVIVGWEAGIDRPNWDSDEKAPRQAIAAGLTGEYPDPRGSGCLPSVERDTVIVVAPGFSDMVFPNSPKVRIKAYLGPDGLRHARDEFVTAHAGDHDADLSYLFISPFVMWRDLAVVVVTRPIEAGGIDIARRNNGGAAYLMRKAGNEWRLLTILRSWGS